MDYTLNFGKILYQLTIISQLFFVYFDSALHRVIHLELKETQP